MGKEAMGKDREGGGKGKLGAEVGDPVGGGGGEGRPSNMWVRAKALGARAGFTLTLPLITSGPGRVM